LQQKENARHPNQVPDGRQAAWVSFTSAAGADLAAVGLYCPVDVVVQRLFLQSTTNPQYRGYKDVFETILRTEGVRGFYRGVGPILVNSLPASAVWWTIYEECKTIFADMFEKWTDKGSEKRKKDGLGRDVVEKHAAANMAAGAVAGGVVTYMTNPLDVVRTRLQTQSMKAQAYQYTSAWQTIREIVKTEGGRALFKGATPRLAEWVIFSAASAFAYEFIVDLSSVK
jgi:solute carrier family 25 folate transporter 32